MHVCKVVWCDDVVITSYIVLCSREPQINIGTLDELPVLLQKHFHGNGIVNLYLIKPVINEASTWGMASKNNKSSMQTEWQPFNIQDTRSTLI